jgi:hypothetical protein
MALLPKAGIGKFLALKSRWNCARLFISARPLTSARKGDFAHCSVARGARSVPPVSDAPSPPVPFFLTPPEGAGGTPSYRRWATARLVVQIKRLAPDRRCLKRAHSGPTEVAAKGKNLARSGLTPVVIAAPQPWRSRAFRVSAKTLATRMRAAGRFIEWLSLASRKAVGRPSRAYRSFATFMSLPLRVRQTTCNNRRRSRDRQPWLRSSPSQRAFCQRLALDTRSPPP